MTWKLLVRISLGSLATSGILLAQLAVTTQHNDLNRTGTNLSETLLNTSNVSVNTFGKRFSRRVDGQIYAQPLYVQNVTIPGRGVHSVVYVCTEHNSVYAFDADNASAWAPLWSVNFGPSGAGTLNALEPEVGITSTPVIDLTSNTLFVVAQTVPGGVPNYQIHALDITTGTEKFGGPTTIQGSVSGTGSGSSNGTVVFNPAKHYQRPGLLLLNNKVYASFGSHGNDEIPFHGWIFVYDSTTLQQTTVLCLTPNGSSGGVWTGGVGPAADSSGNLYVSTGNGTLNVPAGTYGDSIVKLSTSNGLAVADYFAPSNEATLEAGDVDLGSSSPILIPGSSLLVTGGKDGRLFLLNTNNLGQFHSADQVVQEWQATHSLLNGAGGIFGSDMAYYKSTLYLWGRQDALKAFAFNGSTFNTTPVSTTSFSIPDNYSNEPAISISANGTAPGSGIVWAAYSANGPADGKAYPGILRAFDAVDLTNELWNSNQNSARDYSGSWAKWSAPTIANGKVYLGTFDNSLNVFGLLTPGGGSIFGTSDSSQTAANLTAEGSTDWVHWGDTVLNRKAGVTAQISSYFPVVIGEPVIAYQPDPRPLNWSDGAPTGSSASNTNGLYTSGVGKGFSFIAPADTTTRTLVVHVGGWNSGSTLTAQLSDGSATSFVDVVPNTSGLYDHNYTLTYNAASSGNALTVSWTMSSGTGNVSINGVALSVAGNLNETITATAGGSQSTTVGTAFATALQATVKDANNNPVNGVSVTFTAPTAGPSGTFNGSAIVTTNSSGIAIAPLFTANTHAGTYSVTATVSGAATPASFSLTNKPGAPAVITATAGASQSATVGTQFATALQATVKDANNNPVGGVTVTFAAPGSGPSGTFNGSAMVTTNGSGIATAPAFTANAQTGPYSVTATVSGVATPASFSLTNTSVSASGALSGSVTSSTSLANLTTEGVADWVHWGDPSLNRKAGVTAQLSTYSKAVPNETVIAYNPDLRPLSWTDGAPTSSGNNTNGLYTPGIGNGFSFTAPAGTTTRTLIVHVGGWNSGGTLTAHLSDGSAADYVNTTANTSGQYDRNYTLTYTAAASSTLTVTWKMASGSGNVTLSGAALTVGSPGEKITATAGASQSTTVGTQFATALQATVKDANNNAVSGVSVTFAAPSSGPSGTFNGSAIVTTNSSGIAAAPAFTANAQTGAYSVTATVSGVATPASFSLTNTPVSALSGSVTSSTSLANLTTEGVADWVHWGDPSLNRKAGVTAQLSTYSKVVPNEAVIGYNPDLRPLSWTDGAPTGSGGNNTNGLYTPGIGNGFSFTAPAGTTTRTLIVHVGGWNSGGTLTAHLSDGSAADYVNTTANTSGQYDRNYTLTYTAAASSTLTVTWKMASGSGNVTLSGAALQ